MDTSEEDIKLQKEASNIMRELLLPLEQQRESKSADVPSKTVIQVRQLFVGNLPFRVKWQDMKDLFRKAGPVVRADVALNDLSRSKGHGTVLFKTVENAQAAADMFNGYKWEGRILEVRGDRGFLDNSVSKDHDKEASLPSTATEDLSKTKEMSLEEKLVSPSTISPKNKRQQPNTSNAEEHCRQLFVGNLPFSCQWQDLKDLFKNSGRIIRVDIVTNLDGRSRGFGTVLFGSHTDAKKAIESFNGYEFHNRTLRVHFDKFAANHQRAREKEIESFGQRQMHDPASLELLRQTYLPQQTAYQNMISGLINPSLLTSTQQSIYQQQPLSSQQAQQPYTAAASSPLTQGFIPLPSNPTDVDPSNSQSHYSYNGFSFSNDSNASIDNSSYTNNLAGEELYYSGMYEGITSPHMISQHPHPFHWAPSFPPIHMPAPLVHQQYYYPPPMQYPVNEEALSSTLDQLSLSDPPNNSAGLNRSDSNNDNSTTWEDMAIFQEKR